MFDLLCDICGAVVGQSDINSTGGLSGLICENHTPDEIANFYDPPTWEKVRARRNDLLAACDWTQLPDSPLDAAAKSAWAAYRQALRDLPDLFDSPAAVVWPAEP